MSQITHRQYRMLSDHMDVYRFMLELYEQDWRNGVPAPFLEYALTSSWMDKSYVHRNRLWLDGKRIVGLCFYESPVTDVYFSLRPGYEAIADEMVAYADQEMPSKNGKRRFVLFDGQTVLIDAAARLGYEKTSGFVELNYDLSKPLVHPLPDGFRFEPAGALDPCKISLCCWKGFNHEAKEGPWNGDYEGCLGTNVAPHATPQYPVAILNDRDDYVCFAGMWWTPQNHLAYMEPLCTVPEYRRLGLASAALSELSRRMIPLGATHMTGGSIPFYAHLGFQPAIRWTFREKR